MPYKNPIYADIEFKAAVTAFEKQLDKNPQKEVFANVAFAQQYAKGALENMENGRKAVQEKAKFLLPTVLGSFAVTWTVVYVGIDKYFDKPLEGIFFALAAATSLFGWLAIKSFHRLLVATYDFYVAAIFHCAIVLEAMKLHHHWADYVQRAIRRTNGNKFSFFSADEIRTEGKKERKWLPQVALWLLNLGFSSELTRDDEENSSWSARVLESWKAQQGTLLESYETILGAAAFAHLFFFIICLVLAGTLCFKNHQELEAHFSWRKSPPNPTSVSTNLNSGSSLMAISSNISVLNQEVLNIKTNMQTLIGP